MRIALLSLGTVLTAAVSLCAQSAAPRYSWPEAKYRVRVEENVMVPMRDQIRLSTDLYFPIDAGDKLPVILIRTPYDKAPYRDPKSAAHQFSGQGYIVAVQDTRGRFASQGV